MLDLKLFLHLIPQNRFPEMLSNYIVWFYKTIIITSKNGNSEIVINCNLCHLSKLKPLISITVFNQSVPVAFRVTIATSHKYRISDTNRYTGHTRSHHKIVGSVTVLSCEVRYFMGSSGKMRKYRFQIPCDSPCIRTLWPSTQLAFHTSESYKTII